MVRDEHFFLCVIIFSSWPIGETQLHEGPDTKNDFNDHFFFFLQIGKNDAQEVVNWREWADGFFWPKFGTFKFKSFCCMIISSHRFIGSPVQGIIFVHAAYVNAIYEFFFW